MTIQIENPEGHPELWIAGKDSKVNFIEDREIFVVLYDKVANSVLHQGSCHDLALNNRPGVVTTVRICGLGRTESMMLKLTTTNEDISLEGICCEMRQRHLRKGDSVKFEGGHEGKIREVIVREGKEIGIVETLSFTTPVLDKYPIIEAGIDWQTHEIPVNELCLI